MVGLWIALAIIIIVGFLWFAIDRTVRAHRQQAYWGKEELTGKTGVARTELNPHGMVYYDGEIWSAEAEGGPIPAGRDVVIKRLDGLTLIVAIKEGGK